MLCPKCGNECVEGLSSCPSCGAELAENAAVTPAQGDSSDVIQVTSAYEQGKLEGVGKKKGRRKGLVLALIIVLLAAVAGIGYYLKSRQSASLEALIPQDCPFFAAADASWWWDAIEDVRRNESVQKAFRAAEKELEISFERDLVPWMGKTGFVFLDADMRGPQIALIGEVRDQPSFKRWVTRVEAKAAKGLKSRWSPLKYKGVELRRLTVDRDFGNKLSLTTGVVGGWVVLGIGDGSAEKIVDVWKEKMPSVAKSEHWSQAFKKLDVLPSEPVSWCGYDVDSMMKITGRMNPFAAGPRIPDEAKSLVLVAFTEGPSELRMDGISIAKTEKAQDYMHSLAQEIKPVTGKPLDHLPEGTFAAILCSNPGKMIDQLKQMLLGMAPDLYQRNMMMQGIAEVQPVLDAINACEGECALGLIWRDGPGFGALTLGETKSPDSADKAARTLESFASSHGIGVIEDKGLFKVPDATYDYRNFHLLLSWGTKDEWLKTSTHPDWIEAGGKCDLQLPEEVNGSIYAGIGNFTFLPSVLDWAEEEAKGSDKGFIDACRKLGLEKANWLAWTKIDSDGKSGHTVVVLRNWDWRKAVKTIMQYAAKFEKS